MPRKKIVPGDLVTCKHAVDAYYSNYGQNPKMTFHPGMVGKVASIASKVRILGREAGPEYDSCSDMIVIDFFCPNTKNIERASLNFCNAKKTTGTIPSPGDTTYATISRRLYLGYYHGDNATTQLKRDVLDLYGQEHEDTFNAVFTQYHGDNATTQLKRDVLDLYGQEHEDTFNAVFTQYYVPMKNTLLVVLKEFATTIFPTI